MALVEHLQPRGTPNIWDPHGTGNFEGVFCLHSAGRRKFDDSFSTKLPPFFLRDSSGEINGKGSVCTSLKLVGKEVRVFVGHV